MSRPIVLVHGAWGGAHGFRKVRPILTRSGLDVFTPSLTGIGERSHLTHPGVSLSTHVTDVVNTVLYEDLDDIVLLGFSYGGMVVTGALDHIGDRVSALVYLDAFVPADGQSLLAIVGGLLANAPATSGPIAIGDDWLVPPIPRELDDPVETAWSNERRSMQPVKTFSEAVRLSKPQEAWPFSLTYVKATADANESPDSAFWQAARHAEASDRWAYHEIATNHLIPTTHPDDLAAILSPLALGEQSGED
ncbi:MAG: alpha/beta hydrolase [Acidimicrobiales bacterium]